MLKKLFKIDKSTNCKSLEKIIFLDIDGVMNHEHSTEDMDGACLYQLKRIIDCTGAKIVLTSSWKMYYLRGDENPVKLYFEKRLHSFGLELFEIAQKIVSEKLALEIKQGLEKKKTINHM